ncbi:MAG: Sec-independent protein translocase protein TatB [Alphaproteobacteria bacterium]
MLPGLGFQEILLLGVIALLVVGPKDLPVMLRELGKITRKLQAMAAEFRQGFDELARQAELDELRKEVDAMRAATRLPDLETTLTGPDPAVTSTVEPPAEPTTVYGPAGEVLQHSAAAPDAAVEPVTAQAAMPKIEARHDG